MDVDHITTSEESLFLYLDGHRITRHSFNPWNTSGGSCDVFKGTHPTFGNVVLKRPRMSGSTCTESQLRNFKQEARVWKELHHPNILQFVGMIDTGAVIWLISIFAENGTLLQYIVRNPEIDRHDLVHQFTSGLAYLHSNGVVHGDLKSPNLLISAGHTLLIGDFGLSKLAGMSTATSKQGVGSAPWMAPELFKKDQAKTLSSDVYAYGITISEILRQELPFKQYITKLGLMRAILKNERPPTEPQASRRGRSYAILWDIAKKCWDQEPSERPSVFVIRDWLRRDQYTSLPNSDSDITPLTSFHHLNHFTSTRYRSQRLDFEEADDMATDLLSLPTREGDFRSLFSSAPLPWGSLNIRIPNHSDNPSSSRASSLSSLSNALMARYRRQGRVVDLLEATEQRREALILRPQGHPDRPSSLNSLSNALMAWYNREGSLTDLSEATEHYREALQLCPLGHPDHAMNLNNLSNALMARYLREGSLMDLSEATEHRREALKLRPHGHPDRPSSLSNLSNSLMARYNREGNLMDLSEAIKQSREAFEFHHHGHPDRAMSLNSLSNALLTRYRREGSLTDLLEATEHYQEALKLCPPGHSDRAASLNNLSNALMASYLRAGNLADLSYATESRREALELRPHSHPDRAMSLNNLSNALLTRYKREGSLMDLSEATERYREALQLCPPGHPDRAMSLSNLSNALMARYEREANLSDLSEATRQRREALELRPLGHPDRARSLCSLSRTLLHAIDRASDTANVQNYWALASEVFDALHEAVGLSSCPPGHRLNAALEWIDAARKLDSDSTLDAYMAALEQLDIVLATSNTLENKHTKLSSSKELARCGRLGVEAASHAICRGHLTLAVELLERGRNLLFTQVGRYRVDLDNLQMVHAELADRFSDLSCMLDTAVVSNQPNLEGQTAFEDPIERYRRVASDWSQVVDDIRAIEGFQHFLQSPRYAVLRCAAAEGPIVVVIPGDNKSDALVISHQHDVPYHVNLPRATMEDLVELANSLILAIRPQMDPIYDETEMEKLVKKILRSLWNLVVLPIADALENELHIPRHSRIWWCPTSVLSALPLHAAGRYMSRDTNENFPARYVSSYIPTLQALSRARSKCSANKEEKMLIIAQPGKPQSPGWLPNAQGEAELVKKLVEENLEMDATLLSGEEGTRTAVLEGMVHHSWLHLTCHGLHDPSNPFHSGIGLYDVPLTLHDIIQRGLPDATFAFLAACHTATGDLTLLDEGLHLAAGLHFAGFKSVVGTFWDVADIDGPVVAEAFYKALEEEGMDYSKSAYALSKAVQHLRDVGVPIHRWMRYIHLGV